MRKIKKPAIEIIHNFSPEKLDEFKDTSARMRLCWLEEANAFINKAIGFKKRALTDTRFIDLPEGKKTQRPKRRFKD